MDLFCRFYHDVIEPVYTSAVSTAGGVGERVMVEELGRWWMLLCG